MARKHYWQFLVTDEGNPIENANISILIAGTEDPVWVFTDEVGVAGSSTAPQVVTSRKGYFEFWIADENETNGYPLSTKFKIKWSAAGVSEGYIDYIDVFSISIEPVDETDTNTLKNKALSNNLAYLWESHRNSSLPITTVHGIDIINETDTSSSRNKVLSNYQGYIWDYHAKKLWDGSNSTITHPNQLEDVHGIEQVDATITGTEKNKLISNTLAKGWEDHKNNITGSSDHPQFSLINGTRKYTAEAGYASVGAVNYNTMSSTSFVTKQMLGLFEASATILPGDWTNNLNGTYTYTFNHNLGINHPLIVLWEFVGGGIIVQPDEIVSIDPWNIDITVADITNNFFVRVWYQNSTIDPL